MMKKKLNLKINMINYDLLILLFYKSFIVKLFYIEYIRNNPF